MLVSRRGARAAQFIFFYFSLTYFIIVWYSCYQSPIYLTPDRKFPVQTPAFIVPNVLTTLKNVSQDLQFLEAFADISCQTIRFQKNVSFYLRKKGESKKNKIKKWKKKKQNKLKSSNLEHKCKNTEYISLSFILFKVLWHCSEVWAVISDCLELPVLCLW